MNLRLYRGSCTRYPNISNSGPKWCGLLQPTLILPFVSAYDLIYDLRIYNVVFTSGIRCTTLALSVRSLPWPRDPWHSYHPSLVW